MSECLCRVYSLLPSVQSQLSKYPASSVQCRLSRVQCPGPRTWREWRHNGWLGRRGRDAVYPAPCILHIAYRPPPDRLHRPELSRGGPVPLADRSVRHIRVRYSPPPALVQPICRYRSTTAVGGSAPHLTPHSSLLSSTYIGTETEGGGGRSL